VGLPASAGEPPKRLASWTKLGLRAGDTGRVKTIIDPLMLAIFDVDANNWHLLPGEYRFSVGPSSRDLPLTTSVTLHEQRIKP